MRKLSVWVYTKSIGLAYVSWFYWDLDRNNNKMILFLKFFEKNYQNMVRNC